jgi:hypothetical protein
VSAPCTSCIAYPRLFKRRGDVALKVQFIGETYGFLIVSSPAGAGCVPASFLL